MEHLLPLTRGPPKTARTLAAALAGTDPSTQILNENAERTCETTDKGSKRRLGPPADVAECDMLFEYREYVARPGKRDQWVEFMHSRIIPFQIEKGVVVVGTFVSESDPNTFVWIRRFDSEEARAALYEAIYENDEWKNEILPVIVEHLDREQTRIQRLTPTSRSVIR
jgi:NIPSNAP